MANSMLKAENARLILLFDQNRVKARIIALFDTVQINQQAAQQQSAEGAANSLNVTPGKQRGAAYGSKNRQQIDQQRGQYNNVFGDTNGH